MIGKKAVDTCSKELLDFTDQIAQLQLVLGPFSLKVRGQRSILAAKCIGMHQQSRGVGITHKRECLAEVQSTRLVLWQNEMIFFGTNSIGITGDAGESSRCGHVGVSGAAADLRYIEGLAMISQQLNQP